MTTTEMGTGIDEAADEEIRQFLASVEGFATQDLTHRPGNLRALLYGNDGTGKTIAGLALLNYIVPADRTIVLVDTSENWVSLNNHPALLRPLPDGSPRIIRLPYRGEHWLHALAATIARGVPPFDRVGGIQFDEFSTMADSMMAYILKIVEEKNPSRPKDDATWPEYKMLVRKMKNVITTFSALEGVHCTFIAHFRIDKDGRNMPVEAPNFTPSVGPEIRKPMHLIANLSLDEEGNREFQVQPDKGHLAKCKVGGISSRVVLFPELAEKTKLWLNGELPTAPEQKPVERVVAVTDLDTFDAFEMG